jgi:hypothetical protein
VHYSGVAQEMNNQRHLQNLTYRLHQQRELLQPSIVLRKAFLTKAFHAQLRSEKDNIESHIQRMQPGVRKAFLIKRMEFLTKELGGKK